MQISQCGYIDLTGKKKNTSKSLYPTSVQIFYETIKCHISINYIMTRATYN
jgi:hypothetical protein